MYIIYFVKDYFLERGQYILQFRLKSHFEHSRIYENKSLQEKAKSRIPVQNLEDRAKRRLKHVKNTTSKIGLLNFQH